MLESISYDFKQPAFIDFLIAKRKLQRLTLVQANRKYLKAQKIYRKRHNAWKTLKEPYQLLDREINMIQYDEHRISEEAKQKAAAKANKAAKSINKQKPAQTKNLIEQMLANLPKAQRDAVLANFASS